MAEGAAIAHGPDLAQATKGKRNIQLVFRELGFARLFAMIAGEAGSRGSKRRLSNYKVNGTEREGKSK